MKITTHKKTYKFKKRPFKLRKQITFLKCLDQILFFESMRNFQDKYFTYLGNFLQFYLFRKKSVKY